MTPRDAMDDTNTKNTVDFHMVTGLEGLKSLETEWRALSRGMDRRSFYHEYDWFRSRLACRADTDAEPIFVIARLLDGTPVAIFPLQQAKICKGGLPLGSLRIYWPDHMDVNDFIIDDRRLEVNLVRLLIDYLKRQPGIRFHLLELQNVPEAGAIDKAMRAHVVPLTLSERVHCSKYIALGASYDETTSLISGKFKRNLRRKANKLEKSGAIEYATYDDPTEVEKAYETFLEVEANSWKGHEGTRTAVVLDELQCNFYRALVSRFARTGQTRIDVMTVAGKPVAAQLGVVSGDTLHLLKIAYDEAYRNTGPGGLLLNRTLANYSGHSQIKNISFVTGARWNDDWAPRVNGVYTLSVFRPTLPGLCGYALARARYLLICLKRHYLPGDSGNRAPLCVRTDTACKLEESSA